MLAIKTPLTTFVNSLISSKRVKSILIFLSKPYRTKPKRRDPGKAPASRSNCWMTLITAALIGWISVMTSQPNWIRITAHAWHGAQSVVQLELAKNGAYASTSQVSYKNWCKSQKIFENFGSLLKLTCPVRCGFETVHCAEVRPNKRLLKFSYSSLSKRNYPHKTYAFIQKMKN